MSPAIAILSTVAGIALIAIALRDVFDALFHQGARGALSRALMRGTWWTFHRLARVRRGLLPVAGPTMLLVIVATWAAMLAVGWALIFWPQMPEGFYFSSPQGDASRGQFLDAVYMSLVTLATIGFGDITPVHTWLRVLTPLEALLGFGLLSGSISWLLSIYPALLRRHSLAYEIALLREAEQERGLGVGDLTNEAAEGLYAELTSRLVAVERDLVTFPISYYFAAGDRQFALSSVMPYLLELAQRGDQQGSPASLRLRATLLREAIDDFARTTSARFHGHPSDSTEELLEAYARDHYRTSEREKVAYEVPA
ncbi:MAG TPA: potassium channel family protein [Thermoleophilaceae bacterium]|nr:potassium channel family protein [Thermoleophilaceae bacterium]